MQFKRNTLSALCATALFGLGQFAAAPGHATVLVQCPGDTNQDATWTGDEVKPANTKCMHLMAGDGFAKMADGKILYTFGFSDFTGTPAAKATELGILSATTPAPTIELSEGEKFYLTVTNVGMVMRPDLFDPHTVHFHGYPNQAPVFDGLPEASFGVNMGGSLSYFFNVTEPGTYMYHCHMEATEHMQMGMLGNLYVHPKQNGMSKTHAGKIFTRFAYNDGDGSTGYDKSFPLQLGSFDGAFHDASFNVQPLPFVSMSSTYTFINGRGYPDTVNTDADAMKFQNADAPDPTRLFNTQTMHSLIQANVGERVLLRLSNLSVTDFFTVTALGLPPMRVVGGGAHIARGPVAADNIGPVAGLDTSYETGSVTLGGGEAADVLIDTTGVLPGTYFLYTTNLNFLSNDQEDVGGMMTEIVITPAPAP